MSSGTWNNGERKMEKWKDTDEKDWEYLRRGTHRTVCPSSLWMCDVCVRRAYSKCVCVCVWERESVCGCSLPQYMASRETLLQTDCTSTAKGSLRGWAAAYTSALRIQRRVSIVSINSFFFFFYGIWCDRIKKKLFIICTSIVRQDGKARIQPAVYCKVVDVNSRWRWKVQVEAD